MYPKINTLYIICSINALIHFIDQFQMIFTNEPNSEENKVIS